MEQQIENQEVDNQEEVVTEEVQENQVDLSEVEVVSNGQKVDLSEVEDEEAEEATEEEPKEEEDNQEVDPQKGIEENRESMKTAKETLESKGVDFDSLQNEWDTNGELSKESYEALEKAGYPKNVVDAVIDGWQAKNEQFVNAVIKNAGGEEEYARIAKFVTGQGNTAVEAFNEIMQTANLNTINSYVAGIKAQMIAKYGTSNPTLMGKGVVGATKGFSDQTEMTKAISDHRYGRDSAYTKQVEARIAASNFFD